MFCITKWTAAITDSGVDEYTKRLPALKKALIEEKGYLPPLFSFRLLDDDGIVYAYGKSDDDSSFAPLDRYMNDYGCTEIQYKNSETGKYETL